MIKKKKENFKFSGRNHSIKGVISLVMGIISILVFVIISIISSFSNGNGSLILGAIGLLLFLLSLVGTILGVQACKEKEIFYRAPILGMVLNGLLTVVFFMLYMAGVIL